ncbi:MAG: hypothetical protein R6U98_16095 [Pirellulaceae bacterium]
MSLDVGPWAIDFAGHGIDAAPSIGAGCRVACPRLNDKPVRPQSVGGVAIILMPLEACLVRATAYVEGLVIAVANPL